MTTLNASSFGRQGHEYLRGAVQATRYHTRPIPKANWYPAPESTPAERGVLPTSIQTVEKPRWTQRVMNRGRAALQAVNVFNFGRAKAAEAAPTPFAAAMETPTALLSDPTATSKDAENSSNERLPAKAYEKSNWDYRGDDGSKYEGKTSVDRLRERREKEAHRAKLEEANQPPMQPGDNGDHKENNERKDDSAAEQQNAPGQRGHLKLVPELEDTGEQAPVGTTPANGSSVKATLGALYKLHDHKKTEKPGDVIAKLPADNNGEVYESRVFDQVATALGIDMSQIGRPEEATEDVTVVSEIPPVTADTEAARGDVTDLDPTLPLYTKTLSKLAVWHELNAKIVAKGQHVVMETEYSAASAMRAPAQLDPAARDSFISNLPISKDVDVATSTFADSVAVARALNPEFNPDLQDDIILPGLNVKSRDLIANWARSRQPEEVTLQTSEWVMGTDIRGNRNVEVSDETDAQITGTDMRQKNAGIIGTDMRIQQNEITSDKPVVIGRDIRLDRKPALEVTGIDIRNQLNQTPAETIKNKTQPESPVEKAVAEALQPHSDALKQQLARGVDIDTIVGFAEQRLLNAPASSEEALATILSTQATLAEVEAREDPMLAQSTKDILSEMANPERYQQLFGSVGSVESLGFGQLSVVTDFSRKLRRLNPELPLEVHQQIVKRTTAQRRASLGAAA